MLACREVPRAPRAVLGILDLHGQPVPLLDLRFRLRVPPRPPRLSDMVLVIVAGGRLLGLAVDAVTGVRRIDRARIVDAEEIVPGARRLVGIASDGGETLLIYDPERLLSPAERRRVDGALAGDPR